MVYAVVAYLYVNITYMENFVRIAVTLGQRTYYCD